MDKAITSVTGLAKKKAIAAITSSAIAKMPIPTIKDIAEASIAVPMASAASQKIGPEPLGEEGVSSVGRGGGC